MSQNVGSIEYTASIEFGQMVSDSRKVENQLKKTAGSVDSLDASAKSATGSLYNMKTAAIAVSSALAIQQVIEYADAWATVNNKLANSSKQGEITAEVTDRVFRIAQETRSALDATAVTYARLEAATRAYNISGERVAAIAKTINQAFIVSGATAAEAAGSAVQLAQALGAGALRGEEFNSVNEQAPRIMQALADSLGVARGELKSMAAEGKLTTDIVLKALEQQSKAIDEEFSKTIATFSQNMTVARNELVKFVGESTVVQNAVGALGKSFVVLAQNLDTLAAVAGTVATVVGVRMVAGFVAAGGAAATAATAVRLLGVAIGFLGGPVGLIITLIGAAVAAILTLGDSAEDTAAKLNNLSDANKALATAEKELASLQERRKNSNYGPEVTDLTRKIREQEAVVSQLKEKQGELQKAEEKTNQESRISIQEADKFIPKAKQKAAALAALRDEFNKSTIGIQDQNKLNEMATAYREQQAAIEKKYAENKERSNKADKNKDYSFDLQPRDTSNEEAQARLDELLKINQTAQDKILEQQQKRIDEANQLLAYSKISEQEYANALVQIEVNKNAQLAELQSQRDQAEISARERAVELAKEQNALVLTSIDELGRATTSTITGLITGATTAKEAFAQLANTILNEAVNSLVQVGVQYLKNMVIQQSVDKAMLAQKAANSAAYTAAVTAQVGVNTALAAQAAFASTAAIPLIGPALAPAAAAAAAAASSALGAGAVAAAPIAGARQFGGAVSAGSAYRMGETGPEILQGPGNKQYVIPGENGKVIPNNQIESSGGGHTVIVNNYGGDTVDVRKMDDRTIIDIAAQKAVSQIAGQISTKTGPVANAMSSATNTTWKAA